MAEIFPFRAYRYNLERVKLADVVTQPYDKITPAMQAHYAAASPYNLIAVEKGKSSPTDTPADNVYTRAEGALEGWIRDGVLARDTRPGIYVYFQEYAAPGTTERRTRKGFIALGRVEDYAARVIFRHEQTLSGPKADRLELLRHTRTHTGQLFMLYADRQRRIDAVLDEVARQSPPAEARDEYGVVHRVWPVFDRRKIDEIVDAMTSQKLVIADGHHRYETSLAYRDECRKKTRRRSRCRLRKIDDDVFQYARRRAADPAHSSPGGEFGFLRPELLSPKNIFRFRGGRLRVRQRGGSRRGL